MLNKSTPIIPNVSTTNLHNELHINFNLIKAELVTELSGAKRLTYLSANIFTLVNFLWGG